MQVRHNIEQMNRECSAQLITSRKIGVSSSGGHFITCLGADYCPFEAKLNGHLILAKSTHFGYEFGVESVSSATEIFHQHGGDRCAAGYTRIEETSKGHWDVQPNKLDRIFNRVLNRLHPRSKTE